MLTPAQQKLRRELEELKVNGSFTADNIIVLSNKRNPRIKMILLIISILFLLAAFIAVIDNFFKEKTLREHEMIVQYLAKEQSLNLQSNQLVKDCLSNMGNVQSQIKGKQLLMKATSNPAPSVLKDHKEDFLELMEARLSLIIYFNNEKESNELDRLLNEVTVRQELAKESLMRALDQGHIVYIKEPDGTIHFWDKTNSYQYGNG
jgi:hypothetical protein